MGMTQLDVLYRYGVPPSESATLAMAKVREVYGVRRMDLDEAKKTGCRGAEYPLFLVSVLPCFPRP